MINIKFPFYAPKRTSFKLAAEQYLAANIKDFSSEELIFTWESPKPSKADNKGLRYLGKGIVAVSYVSPLAETQFANIKFTSLMGLLVRKAGLENAYTDGNLIKTGEKAVGHNSFYKCGNSSVMHSSLFYDADLGQIDIAAANIKDSGCELSNSGLRELITGLVCEETRQLTFSQIKAIRNIENGK